MVSNWTARIYLVAATRYEDGVLESPNGVYLRRWKWGLHLLVEQEGYTIWMGTSTGWNGPREAVSRCGSAAYKEMGVP